MADDDNNIRHWHLRKEVSYGHLLSTLLMLGMIIGAWSDIQNRMVILEAHPPSPSHIIAEARLDLLEIEVARINVRDVALEQRVEDLIEQLLRRLDRQNLVLDRIETRVNQHDQKTSRKDTK